jgi:hypothetical protein
MRGFWLAGGTCWLSLWGRTAWGGCGRARDQLLDRVVAVKEVLLPQSAQEHADLVDRMMLKVGCALRHGPGQGGTAGRRGSVAVHC